MKILKKKKKTFKNRLLVVCGPTATGKTSLAIKLAKYFSAQGGAELISADSRQVYQGMDIGTGKDHPRDIKIHLIDVAKPNKEFNVFHYYRLAWQKIRGAWQRGKLPILVGGSGFYIQAVVEGVKTVSIPRNLALRAKITSWSVKKLFAYLSRLDPKKAGSLNVSDCQNPPRLIRAIEVAFFKKENPFWQPLPHKKPVVLFIGLRASLPFLYQRIDKRVAKRMKEGLLKEIKGLLKKGYSWSSSALGETLAYQEWQGFFEGRETKEKALERWQFGEHAYARRQMTWFRKRKEIHWFDISKKNWQTKVEKLVREW